jgi:hypothetical protein
MGVDYWGVTIGEKQKKKNKQNIEKRTLKIYLSEQRLADKNLGEQ